MTQIIQYIWQQPSWPEFRWDNAALLKLIGDCRFKQGSLLTQMKDLGFDVRQQASAEVLIEETLKTSEIECERLDPKAVRSSVAQRLGLPTAGMGPTKNQQADGVVQILLDATQNFKQALTPERLFGWHAALFPTGYSGMHKIKIASWRNDRKGPMRVVSGPVGREIIQYEAPPAEGLEKEMDCFFCWWEKSRKEMDGFLRAGMAHLWFVVVHPFEDGNGRIARALTEMALAQGENMSTRYYSLSSQIMAERNDYYRILEHTTNGEGDITDWVEWFLECMSRAFLSSNRLLANVMLKARFWKHYAQTNIKELRVKFLTAYLMLAPVALKGG